MPVEFAPPPAGVQPYRNAAAAIAAVVRARRWCSAVDLSAIRTGLTP
jgi:hypothetical protein